MNNRDRENALKASDRRAKRPNPKQPLAVRQYVLYKLGFITADEFFHAIGKFGYLSPRINFLGVVLNIAITANPFVSIRYEEEIANRLAALANAPPKPITRTSSRVGISRSGVISLIRLLQQGYAGYYPNEGDVPTGNRNGRG